ncbi:MAG: tyrosine-type recombinase/integrase [Candidatus Pacearchaeota archaeon]|jgi:hypothetical protein
MKIDPYKNKESWIKWKVKNSFLIPDISRVNSDLILRYLNDMEKGINVAHLSKKGGRSYVRLNTIKNRIVLIVKHFEARFMVEDIRKITEDQVCSFFSDMRNGEIKKTDGQIYKSVKDYTKIFKAFWHWYQRVEKKRGLDIPDITLYLDTTGNKPDWVYLDEKQLKKLAESAKYEYKILIMFLFDTGIRAPTELVNIKVSDLMNDCKELNISDEISKTFGRRIKLMICPELIKEYIQNKDLKIDDYLFKLHPYVVNKYLKRLGKKVFGDEKSLAGQKYSDLTMYDFRHISCCYWLPRYKSESALKYRFGWKKSDKIHYYSEMLGMKDTISEDDILIDVTKTELEKRIEKSDREKDLMKDEIETLRMQMKQILQLTNQLTMQVRN